MADKVDVDVEQLSSCCYVSSGELDHLSLPDNSSSRNLETSDNSERSENSASDEEDNENVPREIVLSEEYGRTLSSSRGSKPCKERTKSARRKKDKVNSERKMASGSSLKKRRKSASATTNERALSRSIKESEVVFGLIENGEEGRVLRTRNRSQTESSLTRNPSQRKYQCLRYREASINTNSNGIFLDTNKTSVCQLERVKFYETLSVLINLGAGGNADGVDNSVKEVNDYEIAELKEALWLELQAWRNSTTMHEQDDWLMNERRIISQILDDVINFHLDDETSKVKFDVQSSDSESDFESDGEEACCTLHPIFNIMENSILLGEDSFADDSAISSNSDLSEITFNSEDCEARLSKYAQTIRHAVKEVTTMLDRLYEVEQLYPSRGALSKDFILYNSEEFQTSCDTLVLWLNQVKGLYHKLNVMARLVQVDFDDVKVWNDWICLGIGKYFKLCRVGCIL